MFQRDFIPSIILVTHGEIKLASMGDGRNKGMENGMVH